MTGPKPQPPPPGVKMDDVLRRMLATPPDPKKAKKSKKARVKK
jgi:hypothetical protein